MQAEFDHPRSDALVILCVIWAAGVLVTLVGLLAYIAVQAYDPGLSCGDLWVKAFSHGGEGAPPNPDAWDDWELLCDYGYPSAP